MLLVTGMTGRLGRALYPMLKRRKLRVIVRDATESVMFDRNVDVRVVDITDEDALIKACDGVDTVLHMASVVDYSAPRSLMYHVNVNGTRYLRDACLSNNVKNFIYISSTAVYGKHVFGRRMTKPIKETAKCQPTDYYGMTKMYAERLLTDVSDELNTVILRPSMIYGPEFKEGYEYVVGRIKQGKMPIIGRGNNRIPIVHSKDVATAIVKVIRTVGKKDVSGVYNLSVETPLTQEQLYRIVANTLGVEPPKKHVPLWKARLMLRIGSLFKGYDYERMRNYIDKLSSDRVYDITRMKRVFDYRPKIDYNVGIREVVKLLDKQDRAL